MSRLLGKSLNEARIISVRVRLYGKLFISLGKVSLHQFTASLNLELWSKGEILQMNPTLIHSSLEQKEIIISLYLSGEDV